MTPSQTRGLFSGISAELASLMETVEGLSALVAEHARQAPADLRTGILIKAQAVDELHQTLDSLRGVAGSLSEGVAIEAALAAVPLSALADRLEAAALSANPRPEAGPSSGDVVLFD